MASTPCILATLRKRTRNRIPAPVQQQRSTPDMPDPVSKAINGLLNHVSVLEARIKDLESLTGGHLDQVRDNDDIDLDDERLEQ